jgi:hypothetical protein
MAYNSNNHKEKVKFVMEKYNEWKKGKEDIADTRFVKHILPQFGLKMSYSGFMNGYKHWFDGKGSIIEAKKKGKQK